MDQPDWADDVVSEILGDMNGRSGLSTSDIDESIMEEIRASWAAIIRTHLEISNALPECRNPDHLVSCKCAVEQRPAVEPPSAQIVDLMAALKASLAVQGKRP